MRRYEFYVFPCHAVSFCLCSLREFIFEPQFIGFWHGASSHEGQSGIQGDYFSFTDLAEEKLQFNG